MATTTAILAKAEKEGAAIMKKAEEEAAAIMKKAENRIACLTRPPPKSARNVYLITDLDSDHTVIMGVYDSLERAQAAYDEMIELAAAEEPDSKTWYWAVKSCSIVRVPFNTNAPSLTDQPFA